MVQEAVMYTLKQGKNKRTWVVATEIDEYSNEDEYFGIDSINLADS